MVKGVSIKLASYEETVPKLLKLIKFDQELKKHQSIVLKPTLGMDKQKNTETAFAEAVVRFCIEHKNSEAQLFIAEGCDGEDTMDLFNELGYHVLAEKYGIGLVDLNKTHCEEVGSNEFVGFKSIMYPSLLRSSYVISLPKLQKDQRTEISGVIAGMEGAFPARYYKGFFSSKKNKLDQYPLKYRLHDIIVCKLPDFALVDAHEKNVLLAGHALEMDKQGAKLLGLDWKAIAYLRMVDETLESRKKEEENKEEVNR
jgi:uncharacterized protein (DUF362 family)